jgi:serine/threonine-protein kinase
MEHQTAETIAQRAFDLGLLDERKLREIWAALGTHEVGLEEFIQFLVSHEHLTNYQVEKLVKGDRAGYFFGNYRVLYLVGYGTFARVYRAAHRETGKIVAIKVLRSRFSENPVQASLFVREGRLGCVLRHPNIVPIYDVFSKGRMHFLVMEFVEGRNLREFIRHRKKLDPIEAARMMIGITDGMRYAVEHGMTHRDLKVSNVLVSSRGQPKLVDFGLASIDENLSDDALANLSNTRTVDYAALERATGVRKDDARSDIYFLGCIFYHMLTGQPPLQETRDRLQRLSKQRFLDVVPVRKLDPTVPIWASVLVNKAMELDPEKRYQSPAAMLHELRAASRKLARDGADGDQGEPEGDTSSFGGVETGRSVMVVESDTRLQDEFRKWFKQAGYRPLVTSDPLRAFGRLRQDAALADCVVFDAQQLGEAAFETFNKLIDDERTASLPAILVVGAGQQAWKSQAKTAKHRVVLVMPITMRQLHSAIEQLLAKR